MVEVTLKRSETQKIRSYGVEQRQGPAFGRIPDDDDGGEFGENSHFRSIKNTFRTLTSFYDVNKDLTARKSQLGGWTTTDCSFLPACDTVIIKRVFNYPVQIIFSNYTIVQ